MTRFYLHRVNTVEALVETPVRLGVEVDLRSSGSNVIVHHEPFLPGPRFDEWLDSYSHAGIILNVKEEGLEVVVTELLHERGIEDFFFLDQSFPFLMRGVMMGERRAAVRVSDVESRETALALSGHLDWCWVDGFHRPPGEGVDILALQSSGLAVCIASPELHGGQPATLIPSLRTDLSRRRVDPDAICTKRPDLWGWQ